MRTQSKIFVSIHRDTPDAPYSVHHSKHIMTTFWTIPELNIQQDWQLKRIYPAPSCIHILQPDQVIRHQHQAQGLAVLISSVKNHHPYDSTQPQLPKHSPQSRTDTWTVRAIHQTLSFFPLSHSPVFIPVPTAPFHSTHPHNNYMYK